MSPVRSDASTLHVDFENVTDTLIIARNAGVILDYETGAQILDTYGYTGRRCAHIAASGPGDEARLQLLRAWNTPPALEDAVLEFVYRPVLHDPVDLVDWPILRCFTPGRPAGHFEQRLLNDPVYGADAAPTESRSDRARPVALELRAQGKAAEGTYGLDVIARDGRVPTTDLPQAAWTRFILHRRGGRVDLYAGPPGAEEQIGTYPDLLPDGELYQILLGNPGRPEACGSGYWDAVRLGRPRKDRVAPPEKPVPHVGTERPPLPDILPLGPRKHLFIDDGAIERTRNIRRTFHRPQKRPAPLILPDKPWESKAVYLFGGVERSDDGAFRMWYYAADPTTENRKNAHTCLALSPDGLHWEKPALGIHDYKGSRNNNIVIPESGPYSLIVDPDDPRPDFRYKTHLRYQGTQGWTSPDGLHWTSHGVILPQSLDATSIHLDPVRRIYVASIKLGYKGRRYRGYAESEDFLHWTDTCPMMDVDERDAFGDQIYSMKIFHYETLYLGLAKLYHVQTDDTCDIHLAVSRNCKSWERPFRPPRPPEFATRERGPVEAFDAHMQPFLPTGPAGAWDYGNNDVAGTPPIRVGDELWFYHTGRAFNHSGRLPEGVEPSGPAGAIGLATLRLDGFVSADADPGGGELLTRPLRLEGERLYLNANARTGELRVEILDDRCNPIEPFTLKGCRPLKQDGVRLACEWEGGQDLSALAGRTIQLKFHLAGASLYAFWSEAPDRHRGGK